MLFPQREVFESRLHFIDTWLSDRSMPFASIEHEDSAQMRIEEIDEIPLLSHRLSNEGGLNLPCLVE